MSVLRGGLLISVIALGLSAPAVAQPKADAGSGTTTEVALHRFQYLALLFVEQLARG